MPRVAHSKSTCCQDIAIPHGLAVFAAFWICTGSQSAAGRPAGAGEAIVKNDRHSSMISNSNYASFIYTKVVFCHYVNLYIHICEYVYLYIHMCQLQNKIH